jgi:hypothetical protein
MTQFFTRLTPNFNDWQKPSGRDGKCSGANPLYEETNGFGWEEWLFQDYHTGKEICLGFLQAFNDKNSIITSVDMVHLFTRICEGNKPKQFYVGYIKDVKVLTENQRAASTQQKEEKQKDLEEAKITNFPDDDLMWGKCYNIQFERKNVFFAKNFLENEINLHKWQFRFSLYNLNDHPNFLTTINNHL